MARYSMFYVDTSQDMLKLDFNLSQLDPTRTYLGEPKLYTKIIPPYAY